MGLIQSLGTISAESSATAMFTVSVVVPVFDEASTIREVIRAAQRQNLRQQLVIVDDGSSDDTASILASLESPPEVVVVRHATNRGKGAALKTGFGLATGEVVVIQDADDEYDPGDYAALIEPIIKGQADVVYGSRFLTDSDAQMPPATYWANRLITWLFNRATGQRFTDVETCYKAFRREIIARIAPLLVEKRFGIEIEVTARVCKLPGIRIREIPIRYRARTRREGKKIGWVDGLRAIWCIFKYR